MATIKDDAALNTLVMSISDSLIDCGTTKPLSQLTVADVPRLIQSIALHSSILSVKAEIDQFVAGLQASGVGDEIRQNPDAWRPMFVSTSPPLTAGHNNIDKYRRSDNS